MLVARNAYHPMTQGTRVTILVPFRTFEALVRLDTEIPETRQQGPRCYGLCTVSASRSYPAHWSTGSLGYFG